MEYKEIIKKHHAWHGSLADYNAIVKENEITDSDLEYFESVIKQSTESNAGYDGFPDNGGIDIAAILLAEVKRLREVEDAKDYPE